MRYDATTRLNVSINNLNYAENALRNIIAENKGTTKNKLQRWHSRKHQGCVINIDYLECVPKIYIQENVDIRRLGFFYTL